MKKTLLIFLTFVLLFPSAAASQASNNQVKAAGGAEDIKTLDWETAVIEGVAEFLKERAAENALYIAREQINKNQSLKKYFPRTFAITMSLDGLKSITALPRKEWEKIINEDFEDTIKSYVENYKDKFDPTISTDIKTIKFYVDSALNDKQSWAMRISSFICLLEQACALCADPARRPISGQQPEVCLLCGQHEKNEDWEHFKRYALMIPQLLNTKKKEDVVAILKNSTLDPVSFGEKRRNHAKHLSVSAYVGVAGGLEFERNENTTSHGRVGLFAPIGLEYSWGGEKGRSFSILGSAFDFGPVLNAESKGTSGNAKLKDLVAPGLFAVWGWKNKPLACGVGVQRSKGYETNEPQNKVLVFVAFDLPLWMLY